MVETPLLHVLLPNWPIIAIALTLSLLVSLALWLRYLYSDPIPFIPGPTPKNLIFGNFPEIFIHEVGIAYKRWRQEYGPVYKLRGLLGATRLFVSDPVAVKYIMVTRGYTYGKHLGVRVFFRAVEGSRYGMGSLEGDDHRRVRKMMAHAFTTSHVRAVHPTMREYCDLLVALLMRNKEYGERDFLLCMKHTALDIVSAAACGYDAGVLAGRKKPLATCFEQVARSATNDTIRLPLPIAIRAWFPSLEWFLLPDRRLFDRNVKHMRRSAFEVLFMRKQSLGILSEEDEAHIKISGLNIEQERVGNFAQGMEDVLSMLLKASAMMHPDDPDKLEDHWIVANIMVIFLAGHETTSTTMAWMFYELIHHPEVQSKLREELLAAGLDCEVRKLQELPYLNAVVMESLRLHPVSGQTMRFAFEDDVIPLGTPINGQDSIFIPKGTEIIFDHLTLNTREEVWGPDSMIWRPERWLDLPAAVKEDITPGWGYLSNFASGHRHCVGAAFAVLEMKEVLLRLLTHFEFLPPDNPEERKIAAWNRMITKPFVVRDGRKAAPRLPIRIRKLKEDA